MASVRILYLLILIVAYCDCANILYVIPFSAKSHYIMLSPLGLELARKGHNVTVITPFLENDPPFNYHQVKVDDRPVWEVVGGKRPNVFTMADMSAEEFHDNILWPGNIAVTEVVLNLPELQKFLKQDNKFDIVICEQFFQEAFYALAHKYQAPLALITSYGNCMKHNIVTRNPLQLATVVFELLDVKDPTSFLGRFRNWYFTVYEYLWWRYWFLPKNEKLVEKYIPGLPQPVPSLYEIQKNVSLMLLNSHFSFDPATAYLPNIVEVGGIHLSKNDGKLPEDLENILDSAKHGVVYVNFGSNVRSSELPPEKKAAFIKVFGELKQIVIWKWEDDTMPNKPDNLVLRKWLPQKEILAHPNIKVFISHGGLIGMQEAIFNGVPIIGIPIFADQFNNLLQCQEIGFGKVLEYHSLSEDVLRNVLNEFVTNDSYKNKAKEVSARFKDRPMSAMDTAIFWIDYVLRHKGANFIKSPAYNLSWIEYAMIDVYAVLIFAVLILIYLVVKIVKVFLKLFVSQYGSKHLSKKYN